jgi:hypothetical protein
MLAASATTGALAFSIKATPGYNGCFAAAMGPQHVYTFAVNESALFDSAGVPCAPPLRATYFNGVGTYAPPTFASRGMLTRYSLTHPVPSIYALLPTPAPANGNGAVKTLVNASSSNVYVNVTTDATTPQIYGNRSYMSLTMPPSSSKQLTWYDNKWYG